MLEEKDAQLEAMAHELARAQEKLEEIRFKNRRLEGDVQKDQSVFSVQNKKIHYLSKKNQALKMENEGLARMSMSPMVKAPMQRTPTTNSRPSLSAPAETPSGHPDEQMLSCCDSRTKDSPTVMGEFRKKLDVLLCEHDQKHSDALQVLHDSFVCATYLFHMCHMTHLQKRFDALQIVPDVID